MRVLVRPRNSRSVLSRTQSGISASCWNLVTRRRLSDIRVAYNTPIMRRVLATVAVAVAVAAGQRAGAAVARTFTVDPAQSRALIDVGKSGAFSFAGHTHEVE